MAFGTYIDTVLMHNPMGSPEIESQYRASFHNLLSANIRARGLEPQNLTDYGNLRQVVAEPIMVTGRIRSAAVIEPADGTTQQGTVYLKQVTGAIGWDVETLENASGDRQMYDVVVGKWDRFMNGIQAVLNAIDFGDGTGRLARVASNTDNTTYYTVTVDNTAEDFGWDALDLMENGMLVDILTVNTIADGAVWTKKVIRGYVYGVNKTAKTFNVAALSGVTSSSLTAVPANHDFVFLSGAVTLDSDVHWNSFDLPMGLKGIIDDGDALGHEFDNGEGSPFYNGSYYGATFQGMTRATTSMFKAIHRRQVEWAGAANNDSKETATLEALHSTSDMLYASGSTPDPESMILVCSPASYRWLTRTTLSEQNGMQAVDAKGHVLAGMISSGILTTAGRQEVILPVKQDMAVPDGSFMFIDMGRLGIWEKRPIESITPEGTPGAQQFATPGARTLRIERWARGRHNLYTPRCDTMALVDGIDVTQ